MGDINMKVKPFKIIRYVFVLLVLVNVISLQLPKVNAIDTLTFNPVSDTFVESDKPSANQGEFMWLMVDFSNTNTSEDLTRNAYLLFDLTTLSTNISLIKSATLQLQRSWTFPQTTQVGVHSCSDTQWNEMNLTWSNAPPFSPEPLDITTLNPDDEESWISWNVTEAVKNSQENYMTLVLTVEEGTGIYITGFFAKESNYDIPKLVIEYEIIPEFPLWTILPLFLTGTLAVIVFKKKASSLRST